MPRRAGVSSRFMSEASQTQTPPLFERLLPHVVIDGFLGAPLVAQLLAHAQASEAKFTPTRLAEGLAPGLWNSLNTHDLGALGTPLKQKMRDAAPALIEALKIGRFEIAGIELELIAYNDGAFSKTHVDLVARKDSRLASTRVISAAYYFHREPKAFGGGALRFHPMNPSDAAPVFADVEPVNDRLVAFASFAPHEVRTVACPSKAFMDSRFALYFGLRR